MTVDKWRELLLNCNSFLNPHCRHCNQQHNITGGNWNIVTAREKYLPEMFTSSIICAEHHVTQLILIGLKTEQCYKYSVHGNSLCLNFSWVTQDLARVTLAVPWCDSCWTRDALIMFRSEWSTAASGTAARRSFPEYMQDSRTRRTSTLSEKPSDYVSYSLYLILWLPRDEGKIVTRSNKFTNE